MKRSIFAAAAMVAIAFASAAAQAHIAGPDDVMPPTAAPCYVVADAAPLPSAVLLAAEAQEASDARPVVVLLRAEQYAFSLLARQRPEVTPDWRLCSSV